MLRLYFFILIICITFCSCQKQGENQIQWVNASTFSCVQMGPNTLFSSRDKLFCWNSIENKVSLIEDDFFYDHERRSMVVLNDAIYSIRWDTGTLFYYNMNDREFINIAKIYDWEESNYCGYIWTYNGKICNLYQPHLSAQAEVQIRNTKGDLIDSLPLPVKYAYPLFVYNQYLFYQDTNAFGPSHIVNLDNGEDYLLGIYKPIDLIDDHLLVRQQAVWDENGEYQWTGTHDYFLLDKDGNVFPTSVNSNLYAMDDKCCYYGTVNTLYSIMNGKDHDLLRFDKYLPDDYMIDNGVLYMQFRSNCKILSETIQMVDATGENVEAVAEANETRIFLSGGDTLTLALTPDGTLYLLNRS